MVAANPAVQLKRLMARDRRGEADAKARIASQKLTAADKAALGDIVVTNDGTPEALMERLGIVAPELQRCTLRQRLVSGPFVACVGVGIVALSGMFIYAKYREANAAASAARGGEF